MNCKKVFNLDFISDNSTASFFTKTLKLHRENILLDREKALLPETQPYVIIEHQRRDILKLIKELNDRKFELRREERLINNQINGLYRERSRLNIDSVNTEDRKKFIRKCPITDCRGFLSTQWQCGSCEKKICNKCNEEKLEEHNCNPEHVATMEFINKDTKPCPNCGVMIHKISGCSQIFCVDCHTAWDWKTSRIDTGVIHNPHYYEFIARNGNTLRNNGDIPCGGLPDVYTLRNVLSRIYKSKAPEFLYQIHQTITHIQHYEIRNEVNNVDTNRDLRIKYLMNEISEADFKITLQQHEKKRQKITGFRNIYQMFVDVGSDILRQIVVFYKENNKNPDKCAEFIENNIVIIENLITYFNENLKKVGKMYKCVYPGITKDYRFVSNIETVLRGPQALAQ